VTNLCCGWPMGHGFIGGEYNSCQQDLPAGESVLLWRGKGFEWAVDLIRCEAAADMGADLGHVADDFCVAHRSEVNDGFLTGGAMAAFVRWIHVCPVFMAGGRDPELDGFRHCRGLL
jgi:hypothetical protein